MVCFQKGFALIPSKHLSKVVLPFVNTCIIGWGATNNGVRYVGVEVINRGECRILCFYANRIVVTIRLAYSKGKALGSFVDILEQIGIIQNIPPCKGFTFGVKALICNQRQGSAGEKLGLVGLYAVKIELSACDINANQKQIVELHVGTDYCGSRNITSDASHLAVYAELGVFAYTIPIFGSNDVSALIAFIGFVSIGGQHFGAVIVFIKVIPRFNFYCVKIAFGGNGGDGCAANRYLRHGQLDLVDRNGVDRFANNNRGTTYPNVCWVTMFIGNIPICCNLPHQKFFTLGCFVCFDEEIVTIVKHLNFFGVFA